LCPGNFEKGSQQERAIHAVADPIHQDADISSQGSLIGRQEGVVAHPIEKGFRILADFVDHPLRFKTISGELAVSRRDDIQAFFNVDGWLRGWYLGG
jgi:hypothetical protein